MQGAAGRAGEWWKLRVVASCVQLSVYSRNTDCNGLDFDGAVGGGVRFSYRGVLMLGSPLDGTMWVSGAFGVVGPVLAGVVGAGLGVVGR